MVSVAGKRNFKARDESTETGAEIQLTYCRDRAASRNPANSGPFACLREISANLGLPGGPGRIRTSNQTVSPGRRSCMGSSVVPSVSAGKSSSPIPPSSRMGPELARMGPKSERMGPAGTRTNSGGLPYTRDPVRCVDLCQTVRHAPGARVFVICSVLFQELL
jgi:hypothetical protein